ncbi:MAG: nicotinate-nucleotide adenylyltransferase [bacterium]
MKRIGIMGGTFNPIHKGHIALAKAAIDHFALDEVIFIPTGTPPHKKKNEIADKEHRFQMVKLATQKHNKFTVSRLEIDRKGFSYAIDTFTYLKEKFGTSARLFYIMGMDSINEILDWKKPLELFKLCHFIVGTRPGTRVRTFRRLMKFPPLQKELEKIHLMELKENVSASEIRDKLGRGVSVKRLLPATVDSYIRKNKIYGHA